MSKPEIARRCHECGASVREQAAFCPQCGKELAKREESQSIHDTEDLVPPAEPPAAQQTGLSQAKTPETADAAELHDTADVAVDGNLTLTEADFRAPERSELATKKKIKSQSPAPVRQPKSPPVQAALGEVGAKIQRATHRARDVQDNAMHRVQKVREISSVMLEEATYDPSLRFILVAGALFVIFLIIVLLNKLIG